MADSAEIRRARPGDVPGLDAVDAAAWDLSATPGPLPMLPPFDARLPLDGTLVAVRGDTIVGYAAIGARTVHPLARGTALLRSMAVLPAERRRGVARALLAAAGDLARGQGYRQITLFVLGSNHAAMTLYRGSGYEVLVVFPGEFEIDGRLVDDVIMGRSL